MSILHNRIAAGGALLVLMGLMIGAPQIHASAQGITPATVGDYTRPPVPVVRKYVPWMSSSEGPTGIKTFSMSPKAMGLIGGAILATILLANVRVRPRHAR
jgi:hypothetical protein